MVTQRVEAWVLWVRKCREHDAIVCLYSRERGKLHVSVKGIRKMSSRLRPSIVPFAQSEFSLYENRCGGVATLTGIRPLRFLGSLHADFDRIIEASWICEVLDNLTPLEQKSEGKYAVLSRALEMISSADEFRQVRAMFGFALLEHSGYGMQINFCTECRTPATSCRRMQLGRSGLVCERCSDAVLPLIRLDTAVYRWLSAMKDNSWILENHTINRVELDSLICAVDFVIRQYVQKPLKVDLFLRKFGRRSIPVSG